MDSLSRHYHQMVGLNDDWSIEDVQLDVHKQTLTLELQIVGVQGDMSRMSVEMLAEGSRSRTAVAASGCDAVSDDSRGPRSEVSLREMRRQNHLDSVG